MHFVNYLPNQLDNTYQGFQHLSLLLTDTILFELNKLI